MQVACGRQGKAVAKNGRKRLAHAGHRRVAQHQGKVYRAGKAGAARPDVRPGKAQIQRAVPAHGKPRNIVLAARGRKAENGAQQKRQFFCHERIICPAVHHVLVKGIVAIWNNEDKAVVCRIARGRRHLQPIFPAVGIAVQQRQHALHRVAHLGGQICGKIQLHRHCPLQKLAFQLAINICHGQSPSFSMHCGFGSSIIHRAGAV